MEYKVRDIVKIKDLKNNEFVGEIVNINEFRELCFKYAIQIDGFDDVVFVGDENIIELIERKK